MKPNKSELKKYLRRSVQIFKRSLDYTSSCYLILAMFFFYHVGELPNPYNRIQARVQITTPRVTLTSSPTTGFQRKKKDLQDELNEAFSALEHASPPLRGVLLPALPGVSIADSVLMEYRDHLDQLQQNTGVFSTSESFSQAYEYWISQLAKMTTRQGIAFYTQRPLVRLLVEMMKPKEGMSIYDPTVGTGGMLIGCATYIRQRGGSLDSTRFYGREKTPDIWAICQMNLLVHGMENTTIEQGDTLQSTQNPPGSFDLILQNMPLPPDPGNRTRSRRMNTAFLEHIFESLSPSGSAAILAPSSILQPDYQDVWQYVVGRDWLEAVISLPPKVLHGTHASACVLIFNKNKPVERLSQVLFVQYPFQFPRSSLHNEFLDEDIQPIVQAFEGWGSGLDYARVLMISQIEAQNYSLKVDQYPDSVETSQAFDLTAALNRYRSAIHKRETAVERLIQSLEELNLPGQNL